MHFHQHIHDHLLNYRKEHNSTFYSDKNQIQIIQIILVAKFQKKHIQSGNK